MYQKESKSSQRDSSNSNYRGEKEIDCHCALATSTAIIVSGKNQGCHNYWGRKRWKLVYVTDDLKNKDVAGGSCGRGHLNLLVEIIIHGLVPGRPQQWTTDEMSYKWIYILESKVSVLSGLLSTCASQMCLLIVSSIRHWFHQQSLPSGDISLSKGPNPWHDHGEGRHF